MFFNNSNLTTQTKMFPTTGRSWKIQTHWTEDNENRRNDNELISNFSIIKNLNFIFKQTISKEKYKKSEYPSIYYI